MIKINLLGSETESDETGLLWVIGYVTSFVMLVVICVVLQSFEMSSVDSFEQESQTLKKRLADLKEQTKEVKELEKKKADLRQITSAIGKLKLMQVGPVQALDDINMALPSRTWLRDIKEKEGELIISGIALDDYSVSTFMKNLEGSKYFKRIDLQESTTMSLMQVSAFNAFESSLTTYIVPSNEKTTIRTEIKKEADRQGLGVKDDQVPRYLHDWKQGSGEAGKADTTSSQGAYNSGIGSAGGGDKLIGFGTRRLTKEPSIYVWNAPEGTEGKSFVLRVQLDYLKRDQEEPAASEEKKGDSSASGERVPMSAIPAGVPAPSRGGK